MSKPPDGARLAAAKSRFAAFFRELGEAFVEREDVLTQLALALLGREHVLLAGPPGTAKSALVDAVLGRIVDEETGRPSLYARQLTESTVQTDVIGPIDFKTLMATGRTEHFTDEGLLGAVHAFLDEVFDGRDMLLRSTLNLLHERELKQGTQITRGRFEVAVMTTNRYVAEVLESARETLLAFVDRIAFIGFVPRGFADPSRLSEVLRHEIGGLGRPLLEAPLSVQDLDVLQAATDEVFIPEPICDGLARLLDLLDLELLAAERADPSFLPTRYLSTRTAVRSGKILRSICMHDSIFRRPDRPLSIEHKDLRELRLHLLLSGPSPDQSALQIARERDAREKRQLSILRTEREAFERAYRKLPTIRVPPPAPPPPAKPAPERGDATSPAVAAVAVARPWAEAAAQALASGSPARIARSLREVLPHTHAAGEEGALAGALFRMGLAALERQAQRTTLAARTEENVSVSDVVREVTSLADVLDEGPANAKHLARWVRGRALVLLSAQATTALDLGQANVVAWASERDAATLLREAETKLGVIERLAAERAQLAAAGVDPGLRHAADAAWGKGLAVVSEEVTALCDAALRGSATSTLASGESKSLGELLGDVGAVLETLRGLDERASALGLATSLRVSVVGPRIVPLLSHTFGRIEIGDRAAYLGQVEATLRLLGDADLAGVVPVADWLTWAARGLLRADQAAPPGASPPLHDGGFRRLHGSLLHEPRLMGQAPVLNHEGYRQLRGSGSRLPHGYVLAEVALRTFQAVAPAATPASEVPVMAELLAALPATLRRDVAAADRQRIEAVVSFLEGFWEAVDAGIRTSSPEAAADPLRHLVSSRFFSILLDEGAASRSTLEVELLRDLFPEETDAAAALERRIESLVERARGRVLALVRARGDAAWSAALGEVPSAGPPSP